MNTPGLSDDFNIFLGQFDHTLEKIKEKEADWAKESSLKPDQIWKFLEKSTSFFPKLSPENRKKLLDRLVKLDECILKLGEQPTKKLTTIAMKIHQKIVSMVDLFELPKELHELILLSLPSNTDDIKDSVKTFKGLLKERPEYIKPILARWINERKVLAMRLELSLEELKELGPFLLYLDLRDAPYTKQELEDLDFQASFPKVQKLRIDNPKITRLKKLPDALIHLDCHNCLNLSSLSTLPENLISLDICKTKINRTSQLPGLREKFIKIYADFGFKYDQ